MIGERVYFFPPKTVREDILGGNGLWAGTVLAVRWRKVLIGYQLISRLPGSAHDDGRPVAQAVWMPKRKLLPYDVELPLRDLMREEAASRAA